MLVSTQKEGIYIYLPHIEHTSKRLSNIAFYSNTYGRKRKQYIIEHQKIKLLEWEISDIHLHVNFTRKQINIVNNKLGNSPVPHVVLSRFFG